ncbi:MAG: signal peptidase I [Planctomycetota bacterium]
MNQANESVTAPRLVSHAIMLSALMPGLGHWYAGQFVAGLAWAVASTIAGLTSIWLIAQNQIWLAWLPSTGVMVIAAWRACQVARKCPSDYRLRVWNRWDVYAMLLFLCSTGSFGLALLIKQHYVESFVIASASMRPTMAKGDRILVNKAAYRNQSVQRGDIVVFANPEKPRMTYIKRVVALAGDEVEIRDGWLWINEQSSHIAVDPSTPEFGPLTVPKFNCFVLGDNVNDSKDSRHFGPVPLATVGGQAFLTYFPRYQPLDSSN